MTFRLELATSRTTHHVLRPAVPDDAPRLVAMFERCSPASRYARFLAPLRHFPASHLVDVVRSSPIRRSWVVDDLETGDVIAVGSWFRNQADAAEVGLLVEDRWQRLGIGTELMTHMAGVAHAAGFAELIAYPATAMAAVQRLMLDVGRTRVVPDVDLHLHTYLPESAALGLGSVRQRLAG